MLLEIKPKYPVFKTYATHAERMEAQCFTFSLLYGVKPK